MLLTMIYLSLAVAHGDDHKRSPAEDVF